jgi:hypothetical protein
VTSAVVVSAAAAVAAAVRISAAAAAAVVVVAAVVVGAALLGARYFGFLPTQPIFWRTVNGVTAITEFHGKAQIWQISISQTWRAYRRATSGSTFRPSTIPSFAARTTSKIASNILQASL